MPGNPMKGERIHCPASLPLSLFFSPSKWYYYSLKDAVEREIQRRGSLPFTLGLSPVRNLGYS